MKYGPGEFILLALLLGLAAVAGRRIEKIEARLTCIEVGHPCPVEVRRKAA